MRAKIVIETKKIAIVTDYITLGQFLKLADIISSGGYAKAYLSQHSLLINGTPDNRRGRKLYVGDRIDHQGVSYLISSQ